MRVLIADPSMKFREGLRSLLEAFGSEVVGEARTGREALEQVAQHRPDALLMTLPLSEKLDANAVRDLFAALQHTKVVVLTAVAAKADLVAALDLGIQAYLLKTLEAERFSDLLRRVARGEPGLSLELSGKLIRALSGADGSPGADALTKREQQVLDVMARGVTSNRQLARRLRVSENTVKFHVRNILDKLRLHDRTQAVGYALRAKAIRSPGTGD